MKKIVLTSKSSRVDAAGDSMFAAMKRIGSDEEDISGKDARVVTLENPRIEKFRRNYGLPPYRGKSKI
ncbi:MAG: hypothetical protein KJ600_04695 [Nanoarchaeota archaeon]|nr:hypothetical protein [Nanoarchaeota archaeon]MBU1103827.1 hypothetical protein [Nanoarchaeota archaeon]